MAPATHDVQQQQTAPPPPPQQQQQQQQPQQQPHPRQQQQQQQQAQELQQLQQAAHRPPPPQPPPPPPPPPPQQQQQQQQPQQQQQRARGAGSVEVYGFVGWVGSGVAAVLYAAWAFLPEPLLHAAGVSYYPAKRWALIIPAWLIVALLAAYWAYEGANMMCVPPPHALRCVHDAASKWAPQLGRRSGAGATDRRIPPLLHMPAPLASRVLYGGQPFRAAEDALLFGGAHVGGGVSGARVGGG